MLFFIVGIKQSYKIMHNNTYQTKHQYKIYSVLRDEIKKLPNDKVYISYFGLGECTVGPFRKHILKNIVLPTPISIHELYKNFFEKKGISYNNFWKEVCNRDGKIRLLYRQDIYDGGWSTLK